MRIATPGFSIGFAALLLVSCSGGESSDDTSAPAGDVPAPVASVPVDTGDGPPIAFAQCKACHALEPGKNGIGPSLAGVFGAEAGHVGDYAYSKAMRDSGLVWDAVTLDAYLKNPRAAVPGTKMSYAGLRDDAKRAELIAWMESL